jgi:hypothetical protein
MLLKVVRLRSRLVRHAGPLFLFRGLSAFSKSQSLISRWRELNIHDLLRKVRALEACYSTWGK